MQQMCNQYYTHGARKRVLDLLELALRVELLGFLIGMLEPGPRNYANVERLLTTE